jgi:hypothetical protein
MRGFCVNIAFLIGQSLGWNWGIGCRSSAGSAITPLFPQLHAKTAVLWRNSAVKWPVSVNLFQKKYSLFQTLFSFHGCN